MTSAVVAEALRYYREQRAGGLSRAEACAGLARVLKDIWLTGREWHYLCAQCDDYGLIVGECPGGDRPRCGRERPHLAHSYGVPCACRAGERWRPRAVDPEDLVARASRRTQQGRPTAQRGWSRAGEH